MSTTSTGSSSRRSRPPRDAGDSPIPHSPIEVETRLARLGVRPTRALGQSFLHDPFLADAEAALVAEAEGTGAFEVGPGLGILTEAILRRGVTPLHLIERDPRLAAHLRTVFGGRVSVEVGDALRVAWPDLPTLTGNLPFSVASPILNRVMTEGGRRAVVLVQREVAERLAAGPGTRAYGRPSIVAALYGVVSLYQVVPARAFTPTPDVQGQLLVFTPHPTPPSPSRVGAVERILSALFSRRRKMLKNLLPGLVPDQFEARELAVAAGWPEDWERLRPEELGPDAYFRLADLLPADRGAPAG